MKKTPLHILIKQYRVLTLAIVVFFGILTWDMWTWFKVGHGGMSASGAGAFSALALLAAGALKWALENAMKGHQRDQIDDREYDKSDVGGPR